MNTKIVEQKIGRKITYIYPYIIIDSRVYIEIPPLDVYYFLKRIRHKKQLYNKNLYDISDAILDIGFEILNNYYQSLDCFDSFNIKCKSDRSIVLFKKYIKELSEIYN
jgi:hypothetical protein